MTASDIPAELRRFLDKSVDGVEQLEILLLLYHHGDRSWDADSVAESLRLAPRIAAAHLERLAGRDLLDVRIGEEMRYRFSPVTDRQTTMVKRLAASYRENRSAVVALVTARRLRALQDFADAFRIREDDTDG